MLDNISKWFDHIQSPKRELGNKPICPFAKAAIQQKQYTITECTLQTIHDQIDQCDVQQYAVHIFYLPTYTQHTIQSLQDITYKFNDHFKQQDKVVLENDPRVPFTIQGVTTTFSDYYLWIVQSLSDLTIRSNLLKSTDYYSYWTKQQIDEVVTWRTQ